MNEPQEDRDLNSISQLIPDAKAGDRHAQNELFTALRHYLNSIASQNLDGGLKNKLGASDVVQSSFLRIMEGLEGFKGNTTGELRAWIRTIVRNEIIQVRRTYSAEKRSVQREMPLGPLASNAQGIEIRDHNLTPASEAMKAEQEDRFHAILDELSPDEAEVIRLRNVNALSFREVGEKMQRSEQAASQLWYRAILKFEEKLRAADTASTDSPSDRS